MEQVIFRNLEKVRFIIKEATNLEVGYAYEDLVFSEHGLFIIRFNDEDENILYCYFNKEMLPGKEELFRKQLTDVSTLNKTNIIYKGKFELELKEAADEIDIKFYES
ncbi:MAG: hypothetical protein P4L28_00905 [Paludibacteraceae bacterium]|nr:hypothetical protein [Paludibacteraceae bacterium]